MAGTATSRELTRCVRTYIDRFPGEVAALMEAEPPRQIVDLMAGEAPSRGARILERLTPDTGARVLEQKDPGRAAEIVTLLDATRAAALLSRLEAGATEGILGRLDPSVAAELRSLMSYPADTAGQLMDPRATSFRPDTTVRQALARLRATAKRKVFDVCLVDEEGRLTAIVPLQALATAAPGDALSTLAVPAPCVRATTSREEVVEALTARRLASLPVVDIEGRLVGIIRHDALMTAVKEEATADIQTMVGASAEERALSPVRFAVRKRLPWLQINLGTAFLAAAVVGLFEDTIARFTALAVLLPVVAGQSGNTGAQALAVTMRGLALREIRLRHATRVAIKETSVGLVNGIAVSVVTSAGVWVWSRSLGLCLVIGLAMILSMIIASLSGAAIPMALTALGQDPAQSSSILLTTVTDVVGFLSFLGLATLFSALL
jgi:magnesium transporter